MSKRMVQALINKGHKPYIKSHWMELGGKCRAGVVLTFEGHTNHEFKCTYDVANALETNK